MALPTPSPDGYGVTGWGGVGMVSAGGGGGGVGPVVTNFVPADTEDIVPTTPLTFDVLYTAPIGTMTITVLYPATGASETVFNHLGFSANYQPNGLFLGSERSAITGGFHFILRRRSGWFSAPRIIVEGADTSGGTITGAL